MTLGMTPILSDYPIFGTEIRCPQCHQPIPALLLTDSYVCPEHGAFEANPNTGELVHVQSGRCWHQWEGQWYRQHIHPDTLRFEIAEALEHLYRNGYRATQVIVAQRYKEMLGNSLEHHADWFRQFYFVKQRLYGVPVEFSSDQHTEPRWKIMNFEFQTEPGNPTNYTYPFLKAWR
ncbi:MAG: TIGR02652 family protein [Coleofasciculus sp. B1-GNL1-01]